MDEPMQRSPALRALSLLADPQRQPVDAIGWRIVVAHPDDETLALGGQLHRLMGISLILVTDGAPRDGDDARRLGFADPRDYAAARARELDHALSAGGAMPALDTLGYADQEAALNLVALARGLRDRLEGTEVVLTHAFEGGHPDHDATAFAVHAALRMMPEAARPALLEFPLYRCGADGSFLPQAFEPVAGHPPVQAVLAPEDLARKQAMMAAHGSQAAVLQAFDPGIARFRQAPDYDFGDLPNGGLLWYERMGWPIDGQRWLALATAALRELDPGIPR